MIKEIKTNILLNNAVKLNAAIIEKNNSDFLEINDQKAGIFYIYLKNKDADINKEIEINKTKQMTLCIISITEIDINIIEPFKCFRKTVQYSYRGEKTYIPCEYEIKDMELSDLSYFVNHYEYNGNNKDTYLIDTLNRGMLKAVNEKGEIIAFIGEHPEHSVGYLYVNENYRRKGIGKALEQAMINKMIDKGITPIDHVEIKNSVSHKLQNGFNGMKLDEGFVYWLF